MKKLSVVWLIIVGIVFFALGAGVGIMFDQIIFKEPPQDLLTVQQTNKNNRLLKTLTSSTLLPIVANGDVGQISGRDITLGLGGSILTIKINPDAKVYSFLKPTADIKSSKTSNGQQEVKFEDIKVGDSLNIYLQFLSDGNFGGQMIHILARPLSSI